MVINNKFKFGAQFVLRRKDGSSVGVCPRRFWNTFGIFQYIPKNIIKIPGGCLRYASVDTHLTLKCDQLEYFLVYPNK